MKGKNILGIIRWVLGVLFIFAGLASFGDSILNGLAQILFGVSLLPLIWNILDHAIDLKRWVKVLIPVIAFALCVVTSGPADTAEVQMDGLEETVGEQLGASILKSTVEITKEPTPIVTDSSTSIPTPTPTEEPITCDMTVHFLDVGQGLSILVQSDDETLIYDGGDREYSSFVVAYLKQQGITTIDYLISSHYDSDHVSGLIGCLNAFEVKNVISSDYVHDSKTYQSFINAVADEGVTAQHPEVGTEFAFGTGEFIILAPESVDDGESNDNSVAIKLINGENSFIFTGDAESGSEADMISSGIDLSCDVLCLGHHGSASSNSSSFLMETVPLYAVISCGAGNSYGHPHEEVMEYLSAMEVDVYRTDVQETFTVHSDGTNLQWDEEPCNDYSSGEGGDIEESENDIPEPTQPPVVEEEPEVQEQMVWLSATGQKYHSIPDCGNMNPNKARQVTKSAAEAEGKDACKKCW